MHLRAVIQLQQSCQQIYHIREQHTQACGARMGFVPAHWCVQELRSQMQSMGHSCMAAVALPLAAVSMGGAGMGDLYAALSKGIDVSQRLPNTNPPFLLDVPTLST